MTTHQHKTNLWQIICLIHRAWRFRLGRDKQEILTLINHLKPGQTAVDIGAHKGAYTYWMQRHVKPHGHVYAFEPQPLLAKRLKELMNTMKIQHVTIEQMGLSDHAALGKLYVPGDGSPSPAASLVGESLTGLSTTTHEIKLETLDRYFATKKPIHLIKCDVEGHELNVFKSGQKILERDKPLVMFECEERHQSGHTMQDVFEFLIKLGYEGHFFHQGKQWPVSKFHPEMQTNPKSRSYVNNFIFVPQSR